MTTLSDGARRTLRPASRLAAALLLAVLGGGLLAVGAAGALEAPELPGADSVAIARSLLRERKVGEAEGLIRRLLARRERENGPASLATATTLDLLVECLWKERGKRSAEEAIPLAERAVAIKKKLLGPRDPEVAASLFNVGVIRAMNDDLAGAEAVFREVLEIREAQLPPGDPEILGTLNALANVKGFEADYSGAVELYRRALRLAEEKGASARGTVNSIRGNLAGVLGRMGEYGEARSLLEPQVAYYDSTDNPGLSGALNDLANLESSLGDYPRAAALYRRALDLEVARAGPVTTWAINIRGNLALVLVRLGEYGEAHDLLQAEVELLKPWNDRGEDLALSYGRLAHIASELGDREEELSLRRRSLEVLESSLPAGHPRIAEALFNLGQALGEVGRHDEQEDLVHRAQEIWRSRPGTQGAFLADCSVALGTIAQARGDLEGAQRRFEEAYQVETKLRGEGALSLAAILADLAAVAHEEGKPAEARAGLERALAIATNRVGEDHPLAAGYAADLARVELDAGDTRAAIGHAFAAERVLLPDLRLTLRALPERQALLYAGERAGLTDLLLTIVDDDPDPDLASRTWDAVIRARALVFDELGARARSLRLPEGRVSGGTGRAVEAAGSGTAPAYANASSRLANLIVNGPRDLGRDAYQRLLAQARLEMEEAERQLARGDPARPDSRATIGLSEVQAALPAGTALVAYVRYRHLGKRLTGNGTSRYRAFVLSRPGGEVVAVDLGDGSGIDGMIADWRREVARAAGAVSPEGRREGAGEDSSNERETGRLLRRVLWDPLLPHLAGAERIFIVPDGRIHLVNIAALPEDDGRYVIEASPILHELTAEREIVETGQASPRAGGALVLGDPDFDRRPSSRTPVAPPPPPAPGRLMPEPFRGERPDCGDLASMRFRSLAASRREAEEVVDTWVDRFGRSGASTPASGVLALLGKEASEGAFKRLAPGRRLLHLATHGFSLDPGCLGGKDVGPGAHESPPRDQAPAFLPGRGMISNPLLFSGLALAGANRRAGAAAGEEDGILTAQEIAALDLSGTQWAVLSACDSRGGEILRNEGVFGLQRAFRIAGARTVVASLWPVEDEAARSWMHVFYRAALEEGLDTAAAARAASLALLRERRAQGAATHAFYWGGFVASGDWR